MFLVTALEILAIGAAVGGCRRGASAPAAGAGGAGGAASASGPWHPSSLPRIDVHTHIAPGGLDKALAMLEAHGVRHAVNLSGSFAGRGLEEQLEAAAATHGKVSVFANPSWGEAKAPGYGARMADRLARARALGAIGLKISKGLGLGYYGPDRRLLRVDDKGLAPMFEKAGELHMPVAIHTGDPKAFWLPATPANERFDELQVHPGWSFYNEPVASWAELYAQFERRVARHPRTTFIGVHFGNDPEDPDRVAAMLDRYSNLVIDTAARVPEIGRHDPARMHAFFLRYQDRILFGTDAGFGPDDGDLMLGSTGAKPPTPAEVERFWDATWRYFETDDRKMQHPTPIQGRWTVDGIHLPDDVLAKVYAGNAERLLGIHLR